MQRTTGHRSLGQHLVQSGVISGAQLQQAISRQESAPRGQRKLLGTLLVDMGFCEPVDISRAVAQQAGVQEINMLDSPPDHLAMALLSPEDAERYRAIPVAFSPDGLIVAMQHPTDVVALDDLRILTGYDIKPVVASDRDLEMLIRNHAHNSAGIDLSDDQESDRPAIQLANSIIARANEQRASDVHIETFGSYTRVRFRIDGVLHDVMNPPLKLYASLVSRIKVMSGMDIAERRLPQDGRMTMKLEAGTIDVRVSSLPTTFGEKLTLRLLSRSERLITMEELGISEGVLRRYRGTLALPYGLILVTGPTGSGKSTTLYASLATMDSERLNIITIEDPIERRMEGINQIQINPKAGLTFASGLRAIVRADPNVIMVGEVRDRETAALAIESALTGHMVLATMHTNDAAGAISRLTEMGVEPFLTASSLTCVIAQRLARLLCPDCRQQYTITRREAVELEDLPLADDEETVTLYRPRMGGCPNCSDTGYRGRTGVFELLMMSEGTQALAVQQQPSRRVRELAVAEGMVTMRQDGMAKVRRGLISLEEALRVVL